MIHLFIFYCVLGVVFAQQSTFAEEDLKASIQQYQQKIAKAPSGELKKDLACVYYKDQDQERAFQTYLEALQSDVSETSYIPTQTEQHLYLKALDTYLSQEYEPTQKVANQLLDQYLSVANEHPDYYELNYLIAIAQASLDQTIPFFERFYRSYVHLPRHYLAYKTKALLHAKLFMRGKTPEERDVQRQAILLNTEQAIKQYPHDATLYKLLLSFTPESQRFEILQKIIQQIVENNVMISRTDIAVYVEQAVAYNQMELAQELLNKGREWYPFSRTLDEAQQLIKRD